MMTFPGTVAQLKLTWIISYIESWVQQCTAMYSILHHQQWLDNIST